jgi:hypothetical protein
MRYPEVSSDHLCTHRQYRRRFRASRQKSRCRRAPGFIKCKAMKKIKLLSVDAIKAIYEREMAKKGLPAECDETKLAEIVRNVEKVISPGVEIEYITGDEIRKEDDPEQTRFC